MGTRILTERPLTSSEYGARYRAANPEAAKAAGRKWRATKLKQHLLKFPVSEMSSWLLLVPNNKKGRKPRPVLERFRENVLHSSSGCWLWSESKRDKHGYGRFSTHGHKVFAHRVSWVLFRGPILDGKDVLHECDVPACVNPTHLFIGDAKANSQDAQIKGRIPCGENRWNSILTAEQVIEIRRNGISVAKLAKEYGVSAQSIYAVRKGKVWRHLL